MSVPALRFKDDNAQVFPDWSSVALGEIITIMSGISPSSYELKASGDYPFLKVEDLNNCSKYQTYSREYSKSKKNLIPKESIIFPKRGAAILNNKVRITLSPVLMDSNLMAITPIGSELNYEFLYYKILNDKLYKIADTSTIPQINNKHILPYIVSLPIVEEQTKIANFLTAVDEKISQFTQKNDLLIQYKKGVMQQIFSQELRFKDDDGQDYPEWEEKLASDIFINVANKNHDGELPILAATQDKGMIYREDSGLDIKSSEASIKFYKIVERGDFVISLRSFQGGIEYSNVMGICSPAYTVMKPKISINDGFFKAYLKKEDFIESLNSLVIGIRDGKQISYSAFATLIMPYPSTKEQTKIASFLTAIDDKITATQTQLQAVNQYKQGLLQQMFV